MQQPLIRLCLVLHNHQPVGNFEDVFEAAYQDSYLPFLDVFEPFGELSISLHTSGPLATWLFDRHPEYVSRIANLVSQGRIEIVGGAFYEPILAMIPSRDRRGQIQSFSHWLQNHFNGKISGMWMPERVWESEFTSDLAQSNIAYTVLDDFHFRRAGLRQEELTGYFVVENEGDVIRVFPGSETLRYLIPFQDAVETINYCRQFGEANPGSVLVFGDDGEKFGTWPDTKQHVYENGWLSQFFTLLTENKDWLSATTLSDAVTGTLSRGKIFLPDASYREMTEWAMPVGHQIEFDELSHDLDGEGKWQRLQPYVAGGYWRNFKTKYPETNEMYARMMFVSKMVDAAEKNGIGNEVIEKARDYLYQGQCNCSYWHGAFGGIYLPHLRNAVYNNLILADNVIEAAQRSQPNWIECTIEDYDFDGSNEVRLANDKMVAWFSPGQGGTLYELDLRENGHNLLATIQRRPEAYHEKVKQGENKNQDQTASIHDRVVFKQEGLDQRLNYDKHLRKSLVDHFWNQDVSLASIADGTAEEQGQFVESIFGATVRRNPDRIQVLLKRTADVFGQALTVSKGITLVEGSNELEIAYMIEGLPDGFECRFGVEFNFAGMPDGQDDRFFCSDENSNLGQLGTMLNLQSQQRIELVDQWLKLSAALEFDDACSIWTYPVQTVSQSESGFELVHQSVVVQPHWNVRGDQNGRWVAKMRLVTKVGDDSNGSNDDAIAVAKAH